MNRDETTLVIKSTFRKNSVSDSPYLISLLIGLLYCLHSCLYSFGA